MTDIRELLREATADLTTPVSDPVDRTRRAVAKRRRIWAATAGVIALVAAAIVVPLSALGGGTSAVPSDRTSPQPTRSILQTWESADGSVAAGFGSIWGIQCCGGSTRPSWLDRLDPTSGKQLRRIPLPGPTTTVATGAGRVWTIGATDGGPSAISAIDPVTFRVTTMKLVNVHAEPYDIAFAGGSAWVTFDVLDQVWRLTPTATGVEKSVLGVSGSPQDIATTGNGTLWVARETGRSSLTRIVVTRRSAHLGQTVPWRGDIYSPAGGRTLWASSRSLRDIIQLTPAALAGCSACAQTANIVVKGSQVYTALSTPRGLFVSTFGRSPASPGHTDFFSNRDLADNRETPTARISGGGSIAPDGDGVVIGSAGLIHWVPAG